MTALHISTAFDSGAIEVLSLADPSDIQLNIRRDNASEFAQWFHFSLQGAAGLAVNLRFLNAGRCAYPKGWEDYRVVASYDRQHWFRIDTRYDGQVMSAQITPETQRVYFAYFEPYSYERHLNLIGSTAASGRVEVQHLGLTLDGRDMTLLRLTDSHSASSIEPRKKVWLIARQHPGEAMAEWFVEGVLARLLDGDDPVARVLLAHCVFYVVPNMNPDGAVRGNLRTNAAGANLNREWAAPSLERSPEVFLVRQKMQEVGVDLCLDIHGDEGLPYNFCVGTEGNPGYTPRLKSLENAFKTVWQSTCPDFQTAQGYGRAKPGAANLTLATNWVGQNFDCLAFTIEMPFKDNANLPDERVGWSGARSGQLGASVLLPILAVLDQLR
jgi:murein tripeptide amidase MpaA